MRSTPYSACWIRGRRKRNDQLAVYFLLCHVVPGRAHRGLPGSGGPDRPGGHGDQREPDHCCPDNVQRRQLLSPDGHPLLHPGRQPDWGRRPVQKTGQLHRHVLHPFPGRPGIGHHRGFHVLRRNLRLLPGHHRRHRQHYGARNGGGRIQQGIRSCHGPPPPAPWARSSRPASPWSHTVCWQSAL